jgi:hypothetical protein
MFLSRFLQGKAKKSSKLCLGHVCQKHNFVFILIPGLKPRAMDIFLLWRNGNFVIFKDYWLRRFRVPHVLCLLANNVVGPFSLFPFPFRSTFFVPSPNVYGLRFTVHFSLLHSSFYILRSFS